MCYTNYEACVTLSETGTQNHVLMVDPVLCFVRVCVCVCVYAMLLCVCVCVCVCHAAAVCVCVCCRHMTSWLHVLVMW
jgi:hypothetical protein